VEKLAAAEDREKLAAVKGGEDMDRAYGGGGHNGGRISGRGAWGSKPGR
jgi:hypothetical protein